MKTIFHNTPEKSDHRNNNHIKVLEITPQFNRQLSLEKMYKNMKMDYY